MTKTILVTGGAGYIGSHIGYLLAQRGYKVLILDTFLHKQTFAPSWATIMRVDFADEAVLQTLFKQHTIEAVIHCAALIEVGESVKRPQDFYETNVSKVLTLLRVMRSYHINSFIFSSSCAVYGNPIKLPLDEEHPKNPVSPYGRTKLMVEYMLQDFAQAYELRFVSLRYFNAIGALPEHELGEQHEPETHLMPLIMRAIIARTPVKIFGTDYGTRDGTCVRDYVHVLDIARAHLCALDYLNAGGVSDYFNLGTGHGYTVQEMIYAAQEVCGEQALIEYHARRSGDAAVLVAHPAKAEKYLGWKALHTDVKTLLQSAYTWECIRVVDYHKEKRDGNACR